MRLEAGFHFGPWVVVALKDQGGMGEVYLGKDSRSGANVAIKVVPLESEERRKRFETEAHATATLQHAHICPLLDVGVQGESGYLVMPLLVGETLAHRLRTGPLPVSDAIRRSAELARALAHAHANGIVHRDVKPGNVMLTASGAVLLDFGLASLRAEQATPLSSWATGVGGSTDPETMPAGTLYYMAPEQLAGGTIDSRTDLFALGVVMYECLTGRRAFDADSAPECIRRILEDEPAPLESVRPEAPSALRAIVERCLSKSPADRPADAPAVAHALESMATSRTRTVRWAAAAAVLLASSLAGWYALRGGTPDRPRLVVLPCRALSPADGDRVFCRGLTETVTAKLHTLTRAHDLQVVSALDVREHRITTAGEARDALGATIVLDCAVSSPAPDPRVTCELLDAATRDAVSAYTGTVNPTLPLVIQDHVVQWAVGALGLGSDARRPDARAAGSPASQEANALYLQGQGYLLDNTDPRYLEKAEGAFRASIGRDSRFAPAYAALSRVHLLKFRSAKVLSLVESARAACGDVVSIDAAAPDSYLCLAELNRETGKCEAALAYYQQVLDVDPGIDEAYRGKAQCEEQLGRFADAEQTYRLNIDVRPLYWGGYGRLAEFFRRRGDYERAIELWQRVVAMVPGSWSAHASLGAVYVYSGRYEDAVAEYQKSLGLQSNFVGTFNLGQVYLRLRRFPDAIRVLELAKTFPEGDWRTSGALARAYYWDGQRETASSLYAEAIQRGEQALAVNPDDTDTRLLLADYASKAGRREDVVTHLAAAHVVKGDTLSPTDPHALLFAAGAYALIGEGALGREWLVESLRAGLSRAEFDAWIEVDAIRNDEDVQRALATGRSADRQ